jgi:calcium uniporter protein, mitochondrial
MSLWRAAASRLLLTRHSPSSPSAATAALLLHARSFSPPPPRPAQAQPEAEVTPAEARRLVRLVGVEALKRRLRDGRDEVVGYDQLLDACVEAGAARTHAEAEALARALDHAGVVLLFRDKAYLHPEKVAFLERYITLSLHRHRFFVRSHLVPNSNSKLLAAPVTVYSRFQNSGEPLFVILFQIGSTPLLVS